jgi:CheY-like chemotaxis protein
MIGRGMYNDTIDAKAARGYRPGQGQVAQRTEHSFQSCRSGVAQRRTPVECLLIDDSKYDRQRLRRVAEQTRLDIAFTEASDLDAAVSALRTGTFDLILLDQSLPDGDGTAVAELLRAHLGTLAPPIIMISGSVEAALPARAAASGCADYISKDNLSIPGLENAILDTIRTLEPKAGPADRPAKIPQEAARDATAIKAEDLQESLSQVLRLTPRALQRHPDAAQEIAEMEAVCREMWGRLEKAREAAAK